MSLYLDQDEHIELWEHADIQVVTIQKHTLKAGEQAVSFTFPSSGFLCTSRGSALMLLENRVHSVNGVHVYHVGPKGWVQLNAGNEGLDYCLVLYQAKLSDAAPTKLKTIMQVCDPFSSFYQVTPSHPAVVYNTLGQMYEVGCRDQPMARFQLKMLFYQWIYHIVEQYHAQSSSLTVANPAQLVTIALEYMLTHYASPLTLESLSAALDCSPGHLSNRFKQVLNRGPIDCLIHLRMEKARKLLIETQIPLRMVAAAVGYQDVYYFSKAFKKNSGLSPSMLRKNFAENEDFTSQTGINHIVGAQQARG